MRAELALLILVSRLQGATLAENGLLALGDRGADALRGGPPPVCRFELPFHLGQDARVWAEADGIQGLSTGSNAAPEVFLDENYLGVLRVEHGGAWRSPQAVDLSPGAHVLFVRCAAVPDADDILLRQLRVMAELPPAPEPTAVPVKPKPTPRAAAAPTPAPTPEKKPAARKASAGPCGHLNERTDWLRNLPARGKTLSVFSGRKVDGGVMVRIKPGEAWTVKVRVPRGKDGVALALGANWSRDEQGQACYLFSIDPTAPQDREPVDYEPGSWEPLRFEYCAGRLSAKFARSRAFFLPWSQPEAALVVGAQGMELSLKPASSR